MDFDSLSNEEKRRIATGDGDFHALKDAIQMFVTLKLIEHKDDSAALSADYDEIFALCDKAFLHNQECLMAKAIAVVEAKPLMERIC